MKSVLVFFLAAALATSALAQAPAAAGNIPLAAHGCTKPALPDASKKLATAEANAFIRSLETFRNCVQVFAENQKQIAAAKQKAAEEFKASAVFASAAAVAAAASADAAVKDYNEYSEQAVKIVTPKGTEAPKTNISAEPAAPRPARGY